MINRSVCRRNLHLVEPNNTSRNYCTECWYRIAFADIFTKKSVMTGKLIGLRLYHKMEVDTLLWFGIELVYNLGYSTWFVTVRLLTNFKEIFAIRIENKGKIS